MLKGNFDGVSCFEQMIAGCHAYNYDPFEKFIGNTLGVFTKHRETITRQQTDKEKQEINKNIRLHVINTYPNPLPGNPGAQRPLCLVHAELCSFSQTGAQVV